MSQINYFFSGGMGRRGKEPERMAEALTCRLCSCHDAYVRDAEYWGGLLAQYPNQKEFMLDSGAFTAWSKGHEVKLDELMRVYGKLVEKYSPHMQIWLINLDVIPGQAGRDPTPEEIVDAIKRSDENYAKLRQEFGDVVLPVFHQGEDEQRLKDVSEMTNYICVSPRNDVAEVHRVKWAGYVHSLIDNKTHGLATTGEEMMKSSNWGSVDSATWLYIGAMGNVTYLEGNDLRLLSISDESPSKKEFGKHYESMLEGEREQLYARAEVQGFTVEDFQKDHMARKLFNGLEIVEWLRLNDFASPSHTQGTLFGL